MPYIYPGDAVRNMDKLDKLRNRIAEFEYDKKVDNLAIEKMHKRIAELQAQHQEDADLIAEQKREIEILHKVRDKAEEELNELKVDYDSLLEILVDRCKKLS